MATLEYSRVIDAGPGWTQVQLPDGRIITMRGDRAMRNNNPGNLEFRQWERAAPFNALGSDGRFAVFPTREQGMAAQADLIFTNPLYADLTLSQMIERYAPRGENNTDRYLNEVVRRSGISADTIMSNIPEGQRQAVIEAMHAVEGNTRARGYDEQGNHLYTINARDAATPESTPLPPSRLGGHAGSMAASLADAGLLGLDGRMAPPRTFAAPVDPVERSPLSPVMPVPDRMPTRSVFEARNIPLGVTPTPATAGIGNTAPPAPMQGVDMTGYDRLGLMGRVPMAPAVPDQMRPAWPGGPAAGRMGRDLSLPVSPVTMAPLDPRAAAYASGVRGVPLDPTVRAIRQGIDAVRTASAVTAPKAQAMRASPGRERVTNPISTGVPGGRYAGTGIGPNQAVISGRMTPGTVAFSASNPGFSNISLPHGLYGRTSSKYGWSEVVHPEDDVVMGFHPGKVLAVDPTRSKYRAVTPAEAKSLAAKGWSISTSKTNTTGPAKSVSTGMTSRPAHTSPLGFLSALAGPRSASPGRSAAQVGPAMPGNPLGFLAGLLGLGPARGVPAGPMAGTAPSANQSFFGGMFGPSGMFGGFSGPGMSGGGGFGNPGFGGSISSSDDYGGL